MPLPQDPYRRAAQEQANAERLVAQQQRDAERLANTQAKQTAREQKAAADAARKAELSKQELEMRAKGMIPVTTADGNLHPDPLWEQKQAEKAAKEQKDAEAAKLSDQFTREGRKFFTSKVTGLPTALESDAQLEEQRKARADKARRAALDERITAIETSTTDPAKRRLPATAREKLTKQLAKTQQEALFGLQATLQEQAKAVSGGDDWIPFNESATPEAQSAQERLARLSQPDAQLTEEDLAALEANDATKPHVQKLRNIQDLLAKDDEAQKFHEQQAAAAFDLKIRRDDPAAWAERQRQRRASLPPDQLAADLESSSADLTARGHSLNDAFTPIQARRTATQQKLDELRQQAAQRRQQGLTAGEMVTMTNPDGTTETWPADVAAQFEKEQALHQQAEAQDAPLLEKLAAQHADLQAEAALLDEGSARLNEVNKASQTQQAQTAHRALRFTPGMENLPAELESLASEAQTRQQVLADMHPDGIPEEAQQALSADLQQKQEQILAASEAKMTELNAAYGRIRQRVDSGEFAGKDASIAYQQEAQELAAVHGITPDEAIRLLQDIETSTDWDSTLGSQNEQDTPGQTRILSTGGIAVNPSITDEKAYTAAVAASGATPEAQAAAIAAYPQRRAQAAQQVLSTIQEVSSVLGESALNDWENYSAWAKKRPADVDEAEWALRWTEANKARNTGFLGTVLSKTKQVLGSIAAGGNDLRQQASGLLAGLTGSETLMQDAQWAGRKAQAHEERLALGGHTSDNFITKGIFSGLPRVATSIVPAGVGAKAAQIGIRGLAATSLGARLFPGLAAAIEGAATPAQAAKAASTLTGAGIAGASAAGAAQTYAAQLAEIYSTLRREHPDMDHATALRQAQMPSIVSGLATAALTVLGGTTGIERLITRPQEAKALVSKAFATRMQQAGFVGKEFLAGGVKETVEESLDELVSQVASAVGTGHSVQQAVADYLRSLPEMAVATTLLGGAGEGIAAAQESSVVAPGQPAAPPSSIAPEILAGAEAAIDGLQIPNVDEATLARTQDAARGVLYIASGTPLTEMDADTLAALDIVEDPQKPGTFVNGRIVPGKNGVPELQTFDAGQAPVANPDGSAGMRPVRVRMIDGQPVITQPTLDKLGNLLPAVRAAIPLDEKQRIQQLQQPAGPDIGSNQAPAQPAEKNTVQAAPDAGIQPARGGQNAGAAVTPSADAQQRATELATLLEERGFTAPQAAHAAQKVVEAQGIVGASAEEQYAAGIDDELFKLGWVKPQTRKKYEFFGRGTPPTSDTSTPSDAGTPARTAPVEDAADPFAGTPAKEGNTGSSPSPTGDLADRVVVAKQRAMKAVPVASRKRFVKFVSPLTTHLARFQKAFPGGIVFTDAKGKDDLSYTGAGIVVSDATTNPRLEVNLAELFSSADHLNEKDLAAFTRRAVMHEVRHLAALKVIKPSQARALWKDLTPALQARVYASYFAVDIQNATGGKPLSQKQLLDYAKQAVSGVTTVNKVTLPKADPFHMAHEFLRMLDEDAEFAGQTSEAMDANPSLGKAILDFLRSVLDEIKRLIATDLDQSTRVQLREFQKLVEAARKQILAENPADRLGSTKEASAAPLTTAGDARAAVTDKTDKTPTRTDFNPVRGSTGTAYTDSNDAIEYQWAVADVNSLTISNLDNGRINPDYPQELQPRDRTSAASEAQVNDIAKNFNLDRLSASSSVGDGAPIVGHDTVVESGNGRVMGARRAHTARSFSAWTYKKALIARAAEFGLNPEQVEAVANPVLIRLRTTEVNRTAFVLAANVSTIAPKREMEQAKIDAKQIVPDLFDSFVPAEDGEIFTAANAEFIRGFVAGVIPPAERGQIIDASGNLSQSGLRRIRNALFVHAYGTSPEALNALGRLTESIEASDTALARALLAMAPRFAEQNARISSGALYPFSITENLAQALQKLADLRARGEKVETWLAQDRIPGIGDDPGPITTALVQFLHDNRQRPRQILDALDRYAKALDGAGDPRQISLFGDEKPDALTLWKLAASYKEPVLAMGSKKATSFPEELRFAQFVQGGSGEGGGFVTARVRARIEAAEAEGREEIPAGGHGSLMVWPDEAEFIREHGFGRSHLNTTALATYQAAKAGSEAAMRYHADRLIEELITELGEDPATARNTADELLQAARSSSGTLAKASTTPTPGWMVVMPDDYNIVGYIPRSNNRFESQPIYSNGAIRITEEEALAQGIAKERLPYGPATSTGYALAYEEKNPPEDLAPKSIELQKLLRQYGYGRDPQFNSGIKGEGIQFVTQTAKRNGLRDWPNTRNAADYDALIEAVRYRLAGKEPAVKMSPKAALKVYRTLSAKPERTGPQSQALERAERSLGQLFLFDEPNKTLKPAEDLVLEQQTASRATFADSTPEQLRLFMGSKAITTPPPETPEETAGLDAMFGEAARVKPQLDTLTRAIAEQFGATPVIPDKLKGRKRSLDKMRSDYAGAASKLKDLARTTIEAKDLAHAKAIAAEITRRTGQRPKRNLFEANPVDGYRDALFNIVIDGHTVEMQVHVPEILKTKHHLHHAYVVREETYRRAKTENREPTASEWQKIDRMNRIMRRAYNEALGLDPDLGATPEELARRGQAGSAGTSSSASSGFTRNPPLALTSSSEMGRGGSVSNAQPLPLESRTTANASARSDSSGTSMNPVAPGNVEGLVTSEGSTLSPGVQRITLENVREMNPQVDVSDLVGRQKDWRNAFTFPEGSRMLPLSKVIAAKHEPQAVANATRFIGEALRGQRSPRKPVDASANPDGTFTLQDGNATAQALMLAGWKAVPGNLVEAPILAKASTTPGRALAAMSPAFRAWFRNSTMVDANGNPEVYYHGTPAPDTGERYTVTIPGRTFERPSLNGALDAAFGAAPEYFTHLAFTGTGRHEVNPGAPVSIRHTPPKYNAQPFDVFKGGSYFTKDLDYAKNFQRARGGDQGQVYGVYLRVEKPLDFRPLGYQPDRQQIAAFLTSHKLGELVPLYTSGPTWENVRDWMQSADVREILLRKGYDGIHILENKQGTEAVAVLTPSQIKSAGSNSGEYSQENPSILAKASTRVRDADYLAAVETGDMEQAQQLVDEAAKAAGYTRMMYHGTVGADRDYAAEQLRRANANKSPMWQITGPGHYEGTRPGDFDVFKMLDYSPDGLFFFSPERQFADQFRGDWNGRKPGRMIRAWIKAENTFDYHNPDHLRKIADLVEGSVNNAMGWTKLEKPEVIARLRSLGFDSIIVPERRELGDSFIMHDVIDNLAVFNANQIKSAEPVVRRPDGTIRPPSERFNASSDSILAKSTTRVDAGPDLFGFNTGLGLDTLLTPRQKEAKVQQSQQLDLFGGTPNDGPTSTRTQPGSQRREPARRPSSPPTPPQQSEGPEGLFGDLFSFGDAGQRVSASRLPRKSGPRDERAGTGDVGDGVSGPTDQGATDKSANSPAGDPPGLPAAPAVIPQPENPADRNHRIDAGRNVAPKGNKAKLEANFAAMKLLRELEQQGRNPTPEEKRVLAAYTGWGWIKEAFNTIRAQKYAEMRQTAESYIASKPRWEYRRFDKWQDYYTHFGTEDHERILSWADNYFETHERLKAELSDKEFHAAEKSTLNAHFTTPSVIDAMWQAVARLGFKGGRAMEPGGGIGHFIGVQPENLAQRTQWEATELDDVTARILAKLYPQARVNSVMPAPNREIGGMGFQNARIPNNSLDLFISNVPFAKQGPGKAKSEFGQDFNLHNYFFARALAKVKPGGLVAFITTANTMEASRAQRDYLNNHGQLVAAVRLPNTAFKENAGTEVVTDILILRKPDDSDFVGEPWRERVKVGEDVVTSKRGKGDRNSSQKIEDWLGQIDPEWIPADEALVEPFQAWVKGGRPATGQKRNALITAIQNLHGYSVTSLDFRAPIYVNEYFARHPENILGSNRLVGSMYGPGEYTVTPSAEPLETQLASFVERLPEDIMSQSSTNAFEAKAAERGDKVDSYVERDGKIYQVTKEGLEPVEWQVMPGMDNKTKAAAERKMSIFRQWAKLREAAVALVKLEANPVANETEMKSARMLLNQVYDRTVERYGPISKRRNNNYRFLEDDPEAPLLAALEDEERTTSTDGKVIYTYHKADIFRRRLIEPQEAPTTASSMEEAVSISMAWEGTLNPQYVADLLGIDASLARQKLIEGGHAFEDPASGLLMTADEYLSGPVAERLRLAQEAAKDSPQYERNVTALRDALPPHKAISEASVILGQRWIPDSIYTAFLRSIGVEDGQVKFSRELNSFEVRGDGSNEEWNVGTKGAKDIFDAVVNNQTLNYYGYVRGMGMQLDEQLTATLRVKADEMRDAFSAFVKTTDQTVPDPEFEGGSIAIPDLAERDFNQKVNGIKPPNYVGDWVKLPGQSGIIWLKPFRRAVLARLITQGRGMMAHGVGSGKTYNQIALAMELRRLGKARKPVIVVQNSTINQFAASFRKAYPQAKILVATPRSYNAKTRARFTARMATGDWDAIILTHSNIDLIPHSPETVSAYFARELEELDAALLASDGSDQQSDLQKARDKLVEKRDEMMAALGERQDDVLNWEDIGVDALIVDEAHAFKNAPVVTNRGRDIKNIPSSGVGSQRAVSMMMKTRSVRERNNQKGVFFATGTPVSNSMAEAFIMLRYIAPDMLEANGIRNFDDFASQYGDVVSQAEATWDGKVKNVDRFAKFVNGQQLINLVRSVFDVAMGNESLGIDVPTIKGGKPRQIIVPATEANMTFNNWVLRDVSPAWEAISRKDLEENPKLSAVPIMTMQAGIAAALDPRLIHDNAPDDPNSKVNTALREVLRIYKASGPERKTAQVIFSDLFNSFNMDILEGFADHPFEDLGENPVRKGAKARDDGSLPRGNFNLGQDIKAKLIKAGIPEKEIMVVTDQKDEALTNIFDKVNDGDIRVIIGSTGRLGVGVNIQERLAAAHHLMPPRDFKPAMMEQRNGRIIRQGNLHAEWRDLAFVEAVERGGKTRIATKNDKGETLNPSKRAAAAAAWLAQNDKDGSIRAAADKAAREFDIEIIEYGVERSLDSAVYSMMSAKQGMIAQVLTSDAVGNEFEDPSDEIRMSMAEMAAHTMGDPDMIRSVTVDKIYRELRAAYDGFQRMDSSRRSDVRRLSHSIQINTAALPRIDAEAARYGNLWEANESKPVLTFGGLTIDTAAKDAKLTEPLNVWITENAREMALKGQQERTDTLVGNGQDFLITIKGEDAPTENSNGGVYGYVAIPRSDRYVSFNGGARGALMALRRLTESTGSRPAEVRATLAKDTKQLAQIQAYLDKNPGFPRLEELQAIQRERLEIQQRINARNAPPPVPASASAVRQQITIPPLTQADPKLLTPEVKAVLQRAVITDNSLVLPDQLDRKLYEKVNKAIESAGGVWSRKDKAHLFAGDPRSYLGLSPAVDPAAALLSGRGGMIPLPSDTLAKASTQVYTPSSYDTAAPDPFTGIPSLITGQQLTREQGRAIGHAHAQRLRAGLPNSPDRGNASPALAASRAGTLNVEQGSADTPVRIPILSAAQFSRLQKLPLIGEGAEAKVYADRTRGTVYKVLQGYAPVPGVIGSPAIGVWPQVYYTSNGQLDYAFAPADRPRQLVVRLAVQTLVGGTPTEIVGVGPEGHLILKQPLSPAPDIGRDDDFIDNSGLSIARNRAGLVEIPKALLADPESPRVFLAVVEGRPWLLMDLHPDNFVGDNQAQGRINDAIVGQLPASIIAKVPGLAQLVRDAAARAKDLGDRSDRLFKASTAVNPVPAVNNVTPSPLARLGWNHLDRHVSAKLAALARWTDGRTGASQTVAKWTGAAPQKLRDAAHALQREFFPDSVLPREILAKKREMEIKTAMGGQKAMDLVRALSSNPKFSDIAYPAEFAENPIHRRHLYEAMTGERDLATLPKPLQDLATRLRSILIETGREAVKQGRMSTETFDNLRSTYMPHFYEEDVQKEKSLFQRFRLGVRDILAQRTTAWHIEDTSQKDATGQFRLVSHSGNQWRFRNKEHMDAFFEDFIQQQALGELQSRYGKKYRSLTAADLMTPSKLDPEVRGRLQEIKRTLHQRYKRQRPLTIAEQEKAGLIMDPVYAIARYTAQMAHDNSTAEFFNFVASQPALVSDIATPGFTEIPDNPRFGRLAGKFVQDDIAGQLLELIEAPGIALKIYDTILGWWKTGKTVLNPGTHVRNVLGNLFFSQLAGNSVWNPGNATYYRQAITALRQGGPVLTEAYDAGVLGADFVSAELRQTLRQLLPDPATIVEDGKAPSIMSGIGKAIGRFIGTPAGKAYNKIAALYQAEDEVFKLAAFLKAKAMLPDTKAAAEHVRHWFPYFDSGTSGTLRLLGRTAMPFLGFYRESIRIFGHALKERPIALAAGLSVPSIITALSAMALGLDDDDLEEIQKDMRGKAGKLLGPTPLEGMPLFSMLLPFRSESGQVQQFDISAVHPFVDFLGTRVESGPQEDWWQKTLRSFIAAGPIGSLLYSQMTGRDAFGDRTFVEDNMTGTEKAAARLDNMAKTLLPPLFPGGTGFQTLANAGDRTTNKTLEVRDPTQAVLRTVGGLDVRNATPDLYRLADDWRKANGYEVTEGMDYGSTTPASRARKALFAQLAQDEPNLTAIGNILKSLDKMGHPVRTEQDINRLLFYRDPIKLIGGNKAKGISPTDAQSQFRASLQGEARAALENALQEFQRIKVRAPSLIRRATSTP